MWSRHIRRELSAYCEGELQEELTHRLRDHIRICLRCRKQHEEVSRGVLLARHLRRPLCELTWSEIEQALLNPRQRATPRRTYLSLRSTTLIATACLFVMMGYSLFHYFASGKNVDLDRYLTQVESPEPDLAREQISDAPPGFKDADEYEALRAAGIAQAAAEPPLVGYTLIRHRIGNVAGKEVSQLVYRGSNNSFAVFVAPHAVPFSFGKREIGSTTLDGIRCQHVSCTYTSALVFSAARFHCVLVSKSKDYKELAAIVRYFLSAHKASEGS
jgi:anti-sigma factor RsiW